MSDASQRRTIRNCRKRLVKKGLARFQVIGRDADRELVRSFAKHLAEDGPEAARLRTGVVQSIAGEPPRKGGIPEAPRRSPLVGADVVPEHPFEPGRKVDL